MPRKRSVSNSASRSPPRRARGGTSPQAKSPSPPRGAVTYPEPDPVPEQEPKLFVSNLDAEV